MCQGWTLREMTIRHHVVRVDFAGVDKSARCGKGIHCGSEQCRNGQIGTMGDLNSQNNTYILPYFYTGSQKTHQLWNGIAENCKDQFWWNLVEIFKILQNRACMFQFPCRLAFLSTFRLSNRTPKIVQILTLYQSSKRGNFDAAQ